MAQVVAETNSIDLVGLQLSTKSDVIYKFLKEGNLQEAYNLLNGEYHEILMRSNYLKLVYIFYCLYLPSVSDEMSSNLATKLYIFTTEIIQLCLSDTTEIALKLQSEIISRSSDLIIIPDTYLRDYNTLLDKIQRQR